MWNENHKNFGFWASPEDAEPCFPKIEEWLAPQWQPEDRPQLLAYIQGCPVVIAASAGTKVCRRCQQRMNGSAFQSDGAWLWPVSLGHYMQAHEVRIPDALVAYIRSRNYQFPSRVDVPVASLPWPQ